MKILQIINNLGSGGAEKLIVDFVPLMRDKGHDVEVLLLQKKGSIYIDELKQNGIEVTWLSLDKRYSLSHILKIRNFINKGGFDIINVHLFPSLYFVGILSILKLINSNIIYTRHYTKSSRTNNVIFKKIDQTVNTDLPDIIRSGSKSHSPNHHQWFAIMKQVVLLSPLACNFHFIHKVFPILDNS